MATIPAHPTVTLVPNARRRKTCEGRDHCAACERFATERNRARGWTVPAHRRGDA